MTNFKCVVCCTLVGAKSCHLYASLLLDVLSSVRGDIIHDCIIDRDCAEIASRIELRMGAVTWPSSSSTRR